MTGRGRWRMYPRLLLRRTGFDITLLTGLADPPVAAAAADYRDRLAELAALREQLLSAHFPAAVAAASGDRPRLRALSTARGRVGRSAAPPAAALRQLPDGTLARQLSAYQIALATRDQAATALDAAVAAEPQRRQAHLDRLLPQPRLGDALLQLAPSFYDQLQRAQQRWRGQPPATSRDRSIQRRIYLYCQRLAAKNETTSFFGPLVHGRVDPRVTGIALGPETATGVRQVRAAVAFWAVCALARAMAADPAVRPRLPVSRVAACRWTATTIYLPGGDRLRLADQQHQVLEAVNGDRSVTELAAATGLPPALVDGTLRLLERVGAVRAWPEPPSTTPDPLAALLDDAYRYADRTAWPELFEQIRWLGNSCADATEVADRRAALVRVGEMFTQLTGAAAHRHGGQMYADRSVVSLDAEGDQSPVRVDPATARAWEQQLGPVLTVAAHFGELYRQACRQYCARILRENGTASMPYDELIRRLGGQEPGQDDSVWQPLRQATAQIGELVRQREQHGAAVFDPTEWEALAPAANAPAFASPDVMLEAAGSGPPLLVLGEIHPYVFAWGSQGDLCDDPAGLRAAFEADLRPWGGAARLATVVRRRQHKGLVGDWFPGRFIEVTAVASRDRDRVVALTELTVTLASGTPRLCAPDGEVVLYAGDGDHAHLAAFAAPAPRLPVFRIGDRAPRLFVGRVLAQRARWWFPPDAFGQPADDAAHFRQLQQLRSRNGLPRMVFAHVPGEPKPICVDLDAPLAGQALAAVVRAHPAAPEVCLVEMRPGVDRLWLRHQGKPVSSEFRLALRRVPA